VLQLRLLSKKTTAIIQYLAQLLPTVVVVVQASQTPIQQGKLVVLVVAQVEAIVVLQIKVALEIHQALHHHKETMVVMEQSTQP
jgi:hypothetical protein